MIINYYQYFQKKIQNFEFKTFELNSISWIQKNRIQNKVHCRIQKFWIQKFVGKYWIHNFSKRYNRPLFWVLNFFPTFWKNQDFANCPLYLGILRAMQKKCQVKCHYRVLCRVKCLCQVLCQVVEFYATYNTYAKFYAEWNAYAKFYAKYKICALDAQK